MSKHTPGPWMTNGYSSPLAGGITVFSKPFGLGDVAVVADEADARLIAAAPDLLAALQALRLARDQDKYKSWERGVPEFAKAEALADAAIAKATGLPAAGVSDEKK